MAPSNHLRKNTNKRKFDRVRDLTARLQENDRSQTRTGALAKEEDGQKESRQGSAGGSGFAKRTSGFNAPERSIPMQSSHSVVTGFQNNCAGPGQQPKSSQASHEVPSAEMVFDVSVDVSVEDQSWVHSVPDRQGDLANYGADPLQPKAEWLSINNQLREMENNQDGYANKVEEFRSERDRQMAKNEDLRRMVKMLESDCTRLKSYNTDVLAKLDDMETTIFQAENEVRQAKDKLSKMTATKKEKEKELRDMEKTLDFFVQKAEDFWTENETLKTKTERLLESNKDLRKDNGDLTTRVRVQMEQGWDRDHIVEEARKEGARWKSELEDMWSKLHDQEVLIQNLTRERDDALSVIQDAKRQQLAIDEDLHMIDERAMAGQMERSGTQLFAEENELLDKDLHGVAYRPEHGLASVFATPLDCDRLSTPIEGFTTTTAWPVPGTDTRDIHAGSAKRIPSEGDNLLHPWPPESTDFGMGYALSELMANDCAWGEESAPPSPRSNTESTTEREKGLENSRVSDVEIPPAASGPAIKQAVKPLLKSLEEVAETCAPTQDNMEGMKGVQRGADLKLNISQTSSSNEFTKGHATYFRLATPDSTDGPPSPRRNVPWPALAQFTASLQAEQESLCTRVSPISIPPLRLPLPEIGFHETGPKTIPLHHMMSEEQKETRSTHTQHLERSTVNDTVSDSIATQMTSSTSPATSKLSVLGPWTWLRIMWIMVLISLSVAVWDERQKWMSANTAQLAKTVLEWRDESWGSPWDVVVDGWRYDLARKWNVTSEWQT